MFALAEGLCFAKGCVEEGSKLFIIVPHVFTVIYYIFYLIGLKDEF